MFKAHTSLFPSLNQLVLLNLAIFRSVISSILTVRLCQEIRVSSDDLIAPAMRYLSALVDEGVLKRDGRRYILSQAA